MSGIVYAIVLDNFLFLCCYGKEPYPKKLTHAF